MAVFQYNFIQRNMQLAELAMSHSLLICVPHNHIFYSKNEKLDQAMIACGFVCALSIYSILRFSVQAAELL